MLTADAAAERLESWLLPESDADDHRGLPQILTAIGKLPKELREIGYGLFQLNGDGKAIEVHEWEERLRLISAAVRPVDFLSDKNRRKLFSVLCAPLVDEVDATWDLLKTAPYQTGYLRRAFRSITKPESTLLVRANWLREFAEGISLIRPDALTPQWLAVWGTYLKTASDDNLGRFLAAVINRGDKIGQEVFDILCQSARNEHEIAGMSRMTSRALLMADRPDGWDLMEKLLVAAQRQEGLRQVLLETVDEAHPTAFRRMLQIIHDEKLARFSAVARAVDVWCGLNYESDQTKSINEALSRATRYLAQPAARDKAIGSNDPVDVYFGLWATAFEDVHAGIAATKKPRGHHHVEVRFVTAYLLSQMALPEAAAVSRTMLADDDMRVSLMALQGLLSNPTTLEANTVTLFDQIERLLQRMPEKPRQLPAIVWPWTEQTTNREHVAAALVRAAGDLPPTRLLPYLPAIHRHQRVFVIRMLAEQKKWDRLTRETLMELTGNTSPDVREAALDAMSRVQLTEAEVVRIEGLLSRKASDLRIGVLKLLMKLPDGRVFVSAGRLLAAKDSLMRLGGLELLRQMLEADRARSTCITHAQNYAASVAKRTNEEQSQLDVILSAPAERLTLDNALGLMNPAELSPTPVLTAKPVQFFTAATVETLKALDELVHAHRNDVVHFTGWDNTEKEELLGAMYGLPSPTWDEPIESQRSKLPLAEVWESFYRNRPSSQRDSDGLEFLRAERFLNTVCSYWWENVVQWAKIRPERKKWIDAISNGKSPVRLKYGTIVSGVVEWMLFLHPPANAEDFVLDAAETCVALVPKSCHEDLVELAKSCHEPVPYQADDGPIDWRSQYGTQEWHTESQDRRWYREETPQRFAQLWRIAAFISQPVPGAIRHRPRLELAFRAHRSGLATLADLTELLLGTRVISSWGTPFSELSQITARGQDQSGELRTLLSTLPEVVALADRCRERVLEIELARGETPTPATAAALSLTSFGVKTLGRILRVSGGSGFKVTNRYSVEARMARLPTLTQLVKATYPADCDSQADFNKEVAECLKFGFREQTVLELMFLAPQWSKFVEGYFQWPGLSEGLYWFLAHMKYINADAESAATAGGYEADEKEDGKDDREGRSAWQRLIAERTSLSDQERTSGAIDVDWFHRVYAQLSPKRWEQLAAAARFAANPAQARRASYLGEVLLGKAKRKELFAAVTHMKLKESVRLIGLYPLATGTKRAADLAQRYKMLVDYRRYAKGLSGLTKPSAMQALEIGFRNLASTAGYTDPLRLEWAMEADAVKDLAKGPVSASKEGVTVSLALDEFARPAVTVVKNDKPLKSVPAAIKKDKKIIELLERVTDLRRQASRVKESLEAAMCRGDEFDSAELGQLCNHALLKVLLGQLVVVGDDRAGYPVKGGTALRDHTGKQYAVKKNSKLRIAHPKDFLDRGDWSAWQHECFQSSRVQPFKQLFRELYVVTRQEKKDGTRSLRYAGQQVNPQQAKALWNARNWHTQDEIFKAYPAVGITATVAFRCGFGTPLDVEGLTFDTVSFQHRDEIKPLKLANVPPRIFSEVMRDLDLVVSAAHRGGVDPEATASTVEMREALARETCLMLGLKNVTIKQPRVVIKGQLAEYTVHLGSGNIHLMPGGALCVLPVHAQHRGRLFLPFADDDPRTAEIISKVLLLANDHEIKDPSILEQLRF